MGSEQWGSVQGSYWCLPLASTTVELPAFSCADTALMMGRIKGASSESTNKVNVSVILSTRASRPGTFSMAADIALTTLSRNSNMGYWNQLERYEIPRL